MTKECPQTSVLRDDLISRDDALKVLTIHGGKVSYAYNEITALPATDPAAIREAALCEAISLPKYAPTNYGAKAGSQFNGCSNGTSAEARAITAWNRRADLAAVPARVRVKPLVWFCLLYTSPSPRDGLLSRMPSSA